MTEIRFIGGRKSGIVLTTPETDLMDIINIIINNIETYNGKSLKKNNLAVRRISDVHFMVRYITNDDVLAEIYIN